MSQINCHYLNLSLNTKNITKFKGVKYIILQGSSTRNKNLANKLLTEHPYNTYNLSILNTNSIFTIYRIHNILFINHGMGDASITSLLYEITTILKYADNVDVQYIRLGTAGGIGKQPGSIVISDKVYFADTDNFISYTSTSTINQDIMNNTKHILSNSQEIVIGNTISANDFYLAQCRLSSALTPKFTLNDKQVYFKKLQKLKIINIEMEAYALAKFCTSHKINFAIITTILINRIDTEIITTDKFLLTQYTNKMQEGVINYLKSQL